VRVSNSAGQEWLRRPERGNTAILKLFVWVALRLGRPTARLLLYPICLYFLGFSPKARAASNKYLAKVLEHKPKFADSFRHYHCFASTLLDRVFLLNDQSDRFDIHLHGVELATELLARGQGSFLFGAHMGSFEVMRALGHKQPGLRIDMVMYEENARKINSVLNAINPKLAIEIIALGKCDSMLKVEQCLEAGDWVGMLADRALEGEGQIRLPFLGEPAPFPLGPFRLAAMLRRPILLMFGLYRGGKRYDVYFESLNDLSDVPRSQRSELTEQALRRYVQRLEHYCRLAPYNWFNFYDFWK
jgi:predicted LPLAT superfamily acyltransferase